MNCDIFTPESVSTKMISYFPKNIKHLLEPAVGTGNLISAIKGRFAKADVYDINPVYLSKIPVSKSINAINENFLTAKITRKYDGIILNPPYARLQDLDESTRAIIRSMSPILAKGNFDLYVAFLYKCIQHLSDTGTMVAIVPSTWMYNKSCYEFREYLTKNQLIFDIHDYGSEKVFPNADVYCCILVINKLPKESYKYTFETSISNLCLDSIAEIQNGVATLCDKVFIHDVKLYDEPCWKPIRKVSKNIVKFIIFPYDSNGTIYEEDLLKEENPLTYAYLVSNKALLANRDGGKKKYDAWYAFGRKQGINIPKEPMSIYISTLCKPSLPMDVHPTSIFYSGLRITSKNRDLNDIKRIIKDSSEFVQKISSKRSGGWLNISVGVLKQVPIPQ